MNSKLQESKKLLVIEVDGQKIRAMKENTLMCLNYLRQKLQHEITKAQKYFIEDSPIALEDEVSFTILDSLGNSNKVCLKTHLSEIILVIDGNQHQVKVPYDLSLSELRNLRADIIAFDFQFQFEDAPIDLKDEVEVSIADVIDEKKIKLQKAKKRTQIDIPLEIRQLQGHINVNQVGLNDFGKEFLDNYGNPVSSVFDLGKDGQFSQFKLLIGCFYQNENLPQDIQYSTAIPALTCKNFMQVTFEQSEEQFSKKLKHYDCAWVISNSQFQKGQGSEQTFVQSVIEFLSQGKGVMLMGDNEPYFYHANLILAQIDVGNDGRVKLVGNSPGNQMLKRADELQKGCFIQHQITTGIMQNNEGVTICHPVNIKNNSTEDLGNLVTIAKGSSGHATFVCLEGNDSRGRLMIDCGWTKLLKNYFAGNFRYVRNVSVWLLWLENFQDKGLLE